MQLFHLYRLNSNRTEQMATRTRLNIKDAPCINNAYDFANLFRFTENLLSFNGHIFHNIDALMLSVGVHIAFVSHYRMRSYARLLFVYSKLMLMNMNYSSSYRRNALRKSLLTCFTYYTTNYIHRYIYIYIYIACDYGLSNNFLLFVYCMEHKYYVLSYY